MKMQRVKALVAALLLLIGGGALLLGDKPQASPEELTLTFADFDQLMSMPVTQMTPIELATLIQSQSNSYQLIKLDAVENYQIPTTEQLPLNQLTQQSWRLNEQIILYANDSKLALQAYYLLLIRGYFKVMVLEGGLAQWHEQVLFPNKASIPPLQLHARQQLTTFFGGKLVDSQSAAKPKTPLNPIEVVKKKHLHQGC